MDQRVMYGALEEVFRDEPKLLAWLKKTLPHLLAELDRKVLEDPLGALQLPDQVRLMREAAKARRG
jgi:hypothetical protein